MQNKAFRMTKNRQRLIDQGYTIEQIFNSAVTNKPLNKPLSFFDLHDTNRKELEEKKQKENQKQRLIERLTELQNNPMIDGYTKKQRLANGKKQHEQNQALLSEYPIILISPLLWIIPLKLTLLFLSFVLLFVSPVLSIMPFILVFADTPSIEQHEQHIKNKKELINRIKNYPNDVIKFNKWFDDYIEKEKQNIESLLEWLD